MDGEREESAFVNQRLGAQRKWERQTLGAKREEIPEHKYWRGGWGTSWGRLKIPSSLSQRSCHREGRQKKGVEGEKKKRERYVEEANGVGLRTIGSQIEHTKQFFGGKNWRKNRNFMEEEAELSI